MDATTESRIHPEFAIDADDLAALLDRTAETDPRAVPLRVRNSILARPEVFLDLCARVLDRDRDIYLLADKEHNLTAGFAPSDLTDLDPYRAQRLNLPGLVLNREGLSLRAFVLPDLLAMSEAARQEGVLLDLSSTYRSYEYQAGLFDRWVEELGLEEAQRVSARPGTSQHQLGTTMDFGSITPEFADHPAGRWLSAHAGEYGFSLSYPDGFEELTGYAYEPWHFRWIGRDAARIEREFFEGSQYRFLLFLHLSRESFESARNFAEAR